MGARVQVQHYNLGSADSYIGSSLHDLNSVDGPPRDIGGAVVRDGDSLDNDGHSSSANCMHESYTNSLQIHNDGVEEGGSSMDNKEPSGTSYNMLTIEDVSPIESARGRFLQIIVDYFISQHVVEVCENKRDHETDSANVRVGSLNGIREKTLGVALEAAGGLYRKLTKKFPKKGTCMYRRRELATSLETRTRFPELVTHGGEKRVRFVVVNGLDIVEKPDDIPVEDAEWFKRLTGRNEVAVSARDYKFYCPRHKHRRVNSSACSIHGLPQTFPGMDPSTLATVSEDQSQQQHTPSPSKHHMSSMSHHPHQYHQSIHQSHHQHHQSIYQNQHAATHFPGQNHQCDPELSQAQHQSPSISQHMACLQPLTGGHVMATGPAKFCDQCGAQYLRETSKFCSECGAKRLGI
ncbi:PREDICTED: uncharacterized protein At2g02148 isoform X3 [Brassica oleracea var. oleracea]|uniref:uncharacterized protein At2g02148 isoform X3 n=1 Tax=Brassica oleracea var. oleracea TaxID=109376 RepID=UPI0006A74BA8|nr:PREDICTED: uncharacterized protein At2g02148 isoform X3 [Brassica oleracea var. oleracea]